MEATSRRTRRQYSQPRPSGEHSRHIIAVAAEHLNDGGLLLYKDVASRPLWRACANRLHDLVSAQEWIHYVESDDLVNWAIDAGLHLDHREAATMLWYRHECCLFHRTAWDGANRVQKRC
jgi:hypothetical protein